MMLSTLMQPAGESPQTVQPRCPIFGTCGGCRHQDVPYSVELEMKEKGLRESFTRSLTLDDAVFEPIVASPQEYGYRSRLDLKLQRSRHFGVLMGFSPESRNRIVPTDSCAIAMPSIARFLPQLRDEAIAKLPAKYRNANLVIKTGDDGRVLWGGIGRRSLTVGPDDYLWTVVDGKKIFYSLDTFFQANLSILPALIARMKAFPLWSSRVCLYDLYGGVGLFGISLAEKVAKVVLVEENVYAIKLAEHNVAWHRFTHFQIISGRVEKSWESLTSASRDQALVPVGIVDPPRQGLSAEMIKFLTTQNPFRHLFYLSCHPGSLVDNLKELTSSGWEIAKVIPFDFFPRTRHLETLVLLNHEGSPYEHH